MQRLRSLTQPEGLSRLITKYELSNTSTRALLAVGPFVVMALGGLDRGLLYLLRASTLSDARTDARGLCMAHRSRVRVLLKTVGRASASWVRIPPPPCLSM